MSGVEKEGPARQRRIDLPAPFVRYPAGPTGQGKMRGLAVIVGCADYMGNSLGKVKPPCLVIAKRGSAYFRKLAARRKTHGGGRPRKESD
jgi:hypothetical protein